MSSVRKDEYDRIYDYDDYLLEEKIEDLRGNIGRGDCVYCGAKNAMEYEGHVCFICNKCGKSVHEDLYYAWAVGYDISSEED